MRSTPLGRAPVAYEARITQREYLWHIANLGHVRDPIFTYCGLVGSFGKAGGTKDLPTFVRLMVVGMGIAEIAITDRLVNHSTDRACRICLPGPLKGIPKSRFVDPGYRVGM